MAEFKQKIIDERYDELVDEGEINTAISVEVMESIDIILYYITTLEEFEQDEL